METGADRVGRRECPYGNIKPLRVVTVQKNSRRDNHLLLIFIRLFCDVAFCPFVDNLTEFLALHQLKAFGAVGRIIIVFLAERVNALHKENVITEHYGGGLAGFYLFRRVENPSGKRLCAEELTTLS